MNETIIVALKLHIKNKVEMSVQNQKTILKYINKQDKEIERLNKRVKECEEAYLRTRHQYSELESKYVIDEYIINELEMFINERIAILKEEQQEFKEDIPLSNWEEQQSYRNEILIRTNEIIQLEDTLDKLRELKGDGSNE